MSGIEIVGFIAGLVVGLISVVILVRNAKGRKRRPVDPRDFPGSIAPSLLAGKGDGRCPDARGKERP